jgi:chorismate synthase
MRRNFVYNDKRMLRFLTAGESHGQALVGILEGLPAGLRLDLDAVTGELRRRQRGYGRGHRMAIESDRADIVSGVRGGETIGGPIAFVVRNRDWENWQHTMRVEDAAPSPASVGARPPVTRPRPGHADLAGALKYERADLRDVLERASARETAVRVAAGALARQFLAAVDVDIASHVFAIGDVSLDDPYAVSFAAIRAISPDAPMHCVDRDAETRMITAVDRARTAGDTLGGAFEVIAHQVPPGLGSYVQWDRKLDGRLAQALMSIPAIKAVGIGIGAAVAGRSGSTVHDEILLEVRSADGEPAPHLVRPTNRAGGLEGGVTNGEDVRVTAYMKPIATLMKPLRSVDLATMTPEPATIERSDVCAVPAAAVVGEAMVALVLAEALLERYGGDSMAEVRAAHEAWQARTASRLQGTGGPR